MKQSELDKYQAIKEAIDAGHKTSYATSKSVEKYKPLLKKLIPDAAEFILDLGCGRGHLCRWLKQEYPNKEIVGVDPVFYPDNDGYSFAEGNTSDIPLFSEVILCFDVLEHIHPDDLEKSLQEISNKTLTLFIAKVASGSDKCRFGRAKGQELHMIQEPKEWWQEKLKEYFRKVHIVDGLLICYK